MTEQHHGIIVQHAYAEIYMKLKTQSLDYSTVNYMYGRRSVFPAVQIKTNDGRLA